MSPWSNSSILANVVLPHWRGPNKATILLRPSAVRTKRISDFRSIIPGIV